MDSSSSDAAVPLTVKVFLVVAALLTINQLFAVYLESVVAAKFGWPLVFLTAVALVVAVIDFARRVISRSLG